MLIQTVCPDGVTLRATLSHGKKWVQARFTEALMRNMAKVPIASEDIFSTTVSGQPKSEILVDLQRQHPDMEYHFVEDKLGTLEKVRTQPLRVV